MACIGDPVSGDLMIRTLDGDSGSREIKPCGNFWSSPDLYLVGDRVSRTEVRVGGTVQVAALVTNLRREAIDSIEVEAWVCDYTAGHLPNGIQRPPDRVNGFRLNPIEPGETREIVCDQLWTPTARQLATNGGHLCIVANAWSSGVDGRQLIGAEIQPCCNCHHAWRNIQIFAAGTGMRIKKLMRLWGAAGSEQPQDIFVEVFANNDAAAFGAGEKDLLEHSIWARHVKFAGRARGNGKAITLSGRGFEGEHRAELTLDPRKPQELEIDLELPKAKPGAVQVYDVVSRDRKTDEVIGGARMLALTLPDGFKLPKGAPKRR